MGAAQQHQLSFSGVNLEPICSEPNVERGQNIFHSPDDCLNFAFFATDQNLCVVGVLHHNCVIDELTDVIREHAVEERPEGGALKNTDVVGQRVGFFLRHPDRQ